MDGTGPQQLPPISPALPAQGPSLAGCTPVTPSGCLMLGSSLSFSPSPNPNTAIARPGLSWRTHQLHLACNPAGVTALRHRAALCPVKWWDECPSEWSGLPAVAGRAGARMCPKPAHGEQLALQEGQGGQPDPLRGREPPEAGSCGLQVASSLVLHMWHLEALPPLAESPTSASVALAQHMTVLLQGCPHPALPSHPQQGR